MPVTIEVLRIMKKLALNDMKAIAQVRGGLCLSESYEGSKSKLLWRCANGHEWEVANSVKAGTWCRQCAAEARRTSTCSEAEAQNILNYASMRVCDCICMPVHKKGSLSAACSLYF